MSGPRHGFWIRNGTRHDPRTAVELAVVAEESGWDGVFVSDEWVAGHTEPLVLLAAVAARTTTVTLGTWLVPLPARDVLSVARAAANVDALSDGRLLLGLGLGNAHEHDLLGTRPATGTLGARYDEQLGVLDALLRGEEVTHDGSPYLAGARLPVRPAQSPRPPFVLGAGWPSTSPVERAARWEGFMPFGEGFVSEDRDAARAELAECLSAYHEACEDAGRAPGITVMPRTDSWGEDWTAALVDHGVDWVLTCDDLDADGLRAGPPRT